MVVNIASKDELQAVAGKLKNVSEQLTLEAANIIANLSETEDFDGINISKAATAIQNNLQNISGEAEMLSSNLINYVADIKNLDTYNLQIDEETQDNSDQNQRSTTNNTYNVYSNNGSGNNNGFGGRVTAEEQAGLYLLGDDGSSYDNVSNNNREASDINNKNELKSEGQIEITPGDPNYDLGDRYHEYVESDFQMTTGNLAYEISDKDFDLLCAIVSAESDKSYDGSLAVMSTVLNRCEHPNYVALHGSDPVAQATAYNQFIGYYDNGYKQYTNGKYPETVIQAVKDALAGVRNHKICGFSDNNIVTL